MPVIIDDPSVNTDEQWEHIDSIDVEPIEPPLDPEQVTLSDVLGQDGLESGDKAETMS